MITIHNLKKTFGTTWILNGVNLEIPAGKMTVIIGRSGEGKSVLLKQLVGLVKPTSGNILINDIDITTATPPVKKELQKLFGYVFQFAALLDSLTIYQNIGLTLLEQGLSDEVVLPIVKEKLKLVHLSEQILYKYPAELSGGMRKRVGLARTLVTNPQIILYDEPTTGLDPITTRVIHELMYDMQRTLNITSVVISHDIELFHYADYIALLYEGIIAWHGKAHEIWQSDNPFVHQFIRGNTQGPIQQDTDFVP